MKDSTDEDSGLYRSVSVMRYVLPIAVLFLVVLHQTLAQIWFRATPWFPHFLWQVLLYGTVGPAVVWIALGWFARWIRERDEAKAHLHCLYQISGQAATATDIEALVELTLQMPEQIIRPAGTSLILRDSPEGPWTLAGTRNLQKTEEEVLAARLTIASGDLYCGQCADLTATPQHNCPLQFQLPQADTQPRSVSVICLPLSTERPPLALLNIFLFETEGRLAPNARRVLESMAAVLSVALDHARLRAREFHMLHRMEQAARQREGLSTTLEHILQDVAAVYRAQAGEVFLVSSDHKAPTLTPISSWTESEPRPHLLPHAQRALVEGDTGLTTASQNGEYVVALTLSTEGLTMGVLVLTSRRPFTSSQGAFLRVAASMIALIVRNSQLYGKLERQAVQAERNRLAREVHDGLAQSLGFLNFKIQQLDRLIGREQWEAAREALKEMRQGVQDLYAEVRLTIQDLRWFPEGEQGLIERLDQYVLDFGERTHIDVSLDVEGEPCLAPQDEIHLFRIVQEALTNVHKHAQAQHAWVRLREAASGAILEIEDDGKGTSAAPGRLAASSDAPGHFGLQIMQERAEALGGQLCLDSTPGRGTRLQVTIVGPHSPAAYALTTASESK